METAIRESINKYGFLKTLGTWIKRLQLELFRIQN